MPRPHATKQVVNVPFDPELLELVDDFRWVHRFPSRIAAITWLVSSKLAEKPEPKREDVAQFARAS